MNFPVGRRLVAVVPLERCHPVTNNNIVETYFVIIHIYNNIIIERAAYALQSMLLHYAII